MNADADTTTADIPAASDYAKSAAESALDPVNQIPPAGRLLTLGLQHVLVMYAGAIAVPILIGGAAGLPTQDIALLISADLFVCGIASIIQNVGFWKFGIRLPLMMGVTFAAVPPMIAMVTNPALGLLGMFGAIIAAGFIAVLIAPVVGRMVKYFPPTVTGTVIMVTGLNLVPIGINWIAGRGPDAGNPTNLAISLLVLVSIVVIMRYTRGFARSVAVLAGIIIGFVVAASMGRVDFSRVASLPWVELITPFHFGWPTFDLGAIFALSIIMIIVMIETTGMMLAVAEMVGRKVTATDITRGLRVDGLGTMIGGVFNTFPYVTFSQNVGLVGVTGVKSRWVCAMAGAIMIVLALFPKLAILFALIPQYVLGGAGVVMFGMVIAAGIKVLSGVSFSSGGRQAQNNLVIVAISVVVGLMPLLNAQVFSQLPGWMSSFTHSGIVLSAITALGLNLYFNGTGEDSQRQDLADEAGDLVH